MRKKLSKAWQAAKSFSAWVLYELPKSPGLELYGKLIDRDNLDLTYRLRQHGGHSWRDYVAPYLNRDIPKIVWIFWAQGYDEAPALVKFCIDSWRKKNTDWEVRVLSHETLAEYVDASPLADTLPYRFHANLLRLKLLAQFGGVWTDATTICHRPLSEWMPLLGGQTGFFVFRGPHYDRWIDNWFIAAHPKHPLITAWVNSYAKYITSRRRYPSIYFMMIYSLQWRIIWNKDLRLAFRSSGGIPAVPAFFLQAYLEGKSDSKPFRDALAAGFPLSKLNWRLDITDDEFYARLDKAGRL